jgi:N-acetyl-anhydromuramyl-L-alanine amidase AmpD
MHRPLWSGHFDGRGNQVFHGYHWLVRRDGSAERLLPDAAIGWHAGNWEVNRCSVGICIDDDLEECAPQSEVVEGIAALIQDNYPTVAAAPAGAIVGHHEVSKIPTICPGAQFDPGWRRQLVGLVGA